MLSTSHSTPQCRQWTDRLPLGTPTTAGTCPVDKKKELGQVTPTPSQLLPPPISSAPLPPPPPPPHHTHTHRCTSHSTPQCRHWSYRLPPGTPRTAGKCRVDTKKAWTLSGHSSPSRTTTSHPPTPTPLRPNGRTRPLTMECSPRWRHEDLQTDRVMLTWPGLIFTMMLTWRRRTYRATLTCPGLTYRAILTTERRWHTYKVALTWPWLAYRATLTWPR